MFMFITMLIFTYLWESFTIYTRPAGLWTIQGGRLNPKHGAPVMMALIYLANIQDKHPSSWRVIAAQRCLPKLQQKHHCIVQALRMIRYCVHHCVAHTLCVYACE